MTSHMSCNEVKVNVCGLGPGQIRVLLTFLQNSFFNGPFLTFSSAPPQQKHTKTTSVTMKMRKEVAQLLFLTGIFSLANALRPQERGKRSTLGRVQSLAWNSGRRSLQTTDDICNALLVVVGIPSGCTCATTTDTSNFRVECNGWCQECNDEIGLCATYSDVVDYRLLGPNEVQEQGYVETTTYSGTHNDILTVSGNLDGNTCSATINNVPCASCGPSSDLDGTCAAEDDRIDCRNTGKGGVYDDCDGGGSQVTAASIYAAYNSEFFDLDTCYALSGSPSPLPADTGNPTSTLEPSLLPSLSPSPYPSATQSSVPSIQLNLEASQAPSPTPTMKPSYTPSLTPSSIPSSSPSSNMPSDAPSNLPTVLPTLSPSNSPSVSPSSIPTITFTLSTLSLQQFSVTATVSGPGNDSDHILNAMETYLYGVIHNDFPTCASVDLEVSTSNSDRRRLETTTYVFSGTASFRNGAPPLDDVAASQWTALVDTTEVQVAVTEFSNAAGGDTIVVEAVEMGAVNSSNSAAAMAISSREGCMLTTLWATSLFILCSVL